MIPSLTDIKLWLDFSHPGLRILLIWALALLGLHFLRKVLRAIRARTTGIIDAHLDPRRVETLSNVFRYAFEVVILGLASMLTLSEIGISIAPILATAGVAGIAIGFGAQSLVKDFFTGLFLLLENQVSEGDMIEAAGKAGFVERVTLRHIRIRDYDGSVHFIPNSMITLLTNRSRGFAYAVIDVNVPRSADLDRIFDLMRTIAVDMRNNWELGHAIVRRDRHCWSREAGRRSGRHTVPSEGGATEPGAGQGGVSTPHEDGAGCAR
jgi:small-conductance mechanosensitive channel